MEIPKNPKVTQKEIQKDISAKKIYAGTKRSNERLAELGFDPIEKLVELYKSLEAEHEYWMELKKVSQVQELTKGGKHKKTHRYSGHAHAAILAQMEKVANDLMRYNYGRVPETINVNAVKPQGMIVNLAGIEKKPDSEPLIINGKAKVINE